MTLSSPGEDSLGGFGTSGASAGDSVYGEVLWGKSSTTGDNVVGGTEIDGGGGGASLFCVGLPGESASASLPRAGDERGDPPTSIDLAVEASSPLLVAGSDVSRPPDETVGFAPSLDLDPLVGGTELPRFFCDARDADLIGSVSSTLGSRPWYSFEERFAGATASARYGFITCLRLPTGLGFGLAVSNAL